MYVGIWNILSAATIVGKMEHWSLVSMLQACDSSPWERSVSLLFTTLWSQGRNLAFFQDEWFGISVTQILCSFWQFLSDFLRYPMDCFSRTPLVLIDHDQEHLAVVYFIKNYIERCLTLTTTFSHHTAYHFSYQFCCLFLSYWYGILTTGTRPGTLRFNTTASGISISL